MLLNIYTVPKQLWDTSMRFLNVLRYVYETLYNFCSVIENENISSYFEKGAKLITSPFQNAKKHAYPHKTIQVIIIV